MISYADYLTMQIRLAKHDPCAETATLGPGVDDESELHQDILESCQRRGWLAFHGSMAHRTYRTKGEPDWIVCADAGRVLFVECKTRTGKLSPDQEGVILWAKKLGHTVHVVRSLAEFEQIADQPKDQP